MLASILQSVASLIGCVALLALIIWLNNNHERRLRREGRISLNPVEPKDGTNFLEQVGFTVIVLAAGGAIMFVISRLP